MNDKISPADQLRLEHFQPLVGRMFLADCTPKAAEIMLAEARLTAPSRDYVEQFGRLPFTLIFHTPPSRLLVEGIYQMKCGDFGPVPIYIEQTAPPVTGTVAGYYYQAVFY